MQANLIELQARKADLLLEVKSREDAVREPLRQYRVSSSLLTNQQRQLKDQEDKLKFRIEMLHVSQYSTLLLITCTCTSVAIKLKKPDFDVR